MLGTRYNAPTLQIQLCRSFLPQHAWIKLTKLKTIECPFISYKFDYVNLYPLIPMDSPYLTSDFASQL